MYIYIYTYFNRNISILFNFRGRRRFLLFNGVLLLQEIPKKLVALYMNYYKALRLENLESKKYKVISL